MWYYSTDPFLARWQQVKQATAGVAVDFYYALCVHRHLILPAPQMIIRWVSVSIWWVNSAEHSYAGSCTSHLSLYLLSVFSSTSFERKSCSRALFIRVETASLCYLFSQTLNRSLASPHSQTWVHAFAQFLFTTSLPCVPCPPGCTIVDFLQRLIHGDIGLWAKIFFNSTKRQIRVCWKCSQQTLSSALPMRDKFMSLLRCLMALLDVELFCSLFTTYSKNTYLRLPWCQRKENILACLIKAVQKYYMEANLIHEIKLLEGQDCNCATCSWCLRLIKSTQNG